jgi:hypothetical protein
MMLTSPLIRPILHDEGLTRGLGDPEARALVEWLVDRAEEAADAAPDEDCARRHVARLCRRARAVGRFVVLWSYRGDHAAAHQLAGAERFGWTLPSEPLDPFDLMRAILSWEAEHPA